MDAAYDQFSHQYKQSKELPFRPHAEAHLFFEMLGDPTGHAPIVSEDGVREFGQEYWQDFLDIVPMIGIECHIGNDAPHERTKSA